jgi:hypothetical protein
MVCNTQNHWVPRLRPSWIDEVHKPNDSESRFCFLWYMLAESVFVEEGYSAGKNPQAIAANLL